MKILASDLDGTLIREQKISTKDLEALKKLKENGHKIIVSTGRTLSGVKDIFKNFKFDYDYLLLCNGGLILNKNNEVIHNEVISNDIKNGIINDFYNKENVLMYYDDGKDTFLIENNLVKVSEAMEEDFIETFSNKIDKDRALNAKGTYQMMSTFNTNGSIKETEQLKELLINKYSNYVDVFRNQCFVDIVPKGCSKGNGIMFILKEYEKLDIECLYTVGDSLNDISMFDITKNSYTFNCAEEVVKPYANNIVDNVDEVIEDMLK